MQTMLIRLAIVTVGLAGTLNLAGCVDNQDPQQAMYDRQQKAIKDPQHYSPWSDNTDMNNSGIGDSKGLGKDWNDFWNP